MTLESIAEVSLTFAQAHPEALAEAIATHRQSKVVDVVDLSYNSTVLTVCCAAGFLRELIAADCTVRHVRIDHTDFAAAAPHPAWRSPEVGAPLCTCAAWGWERMLFELFCACARGGLESLSVQESITIAHQSCAVDGAWLCGQMAALSEPPVKTSLALSFRGVDSAESANAARWALQRVDCMLRCISDGAAVVADPSWRVSSSAASYENVAIVKATPSVAIDAADSLTATNRAAKVMCCAPVPVVWAPKPAQLPPAAEEDDDIAGPKKKTKKLKKKRKAKVEDAAAEGETTTTKVVAARKAIPQNENAVPALKRDVVAQKPGAVIATNGAGTVGSHHHQSTSLYTSHAALSARVLNMVKPRPRLVL